MLLHFTFLWVGLLVLFPLLVLAHELGHARAAIRAGKRPVVIVGTTPGLVQRRFRTFDLHFHFHLNEWAEQKSGICLVNHSGLTVGQMRSILLGGPRASALSGVVLAALAIVIGDPLSPLFPPIAMGSMLAFKSAVRNLGLLGGGRSPDSDGSQLARLRGLDADVLLPPMPIAKIVGPL